MYQSNQEGVRIRKSIQKGLCESLESTCVKVCVIRILRKRNTQKGKISACEPPGVSKPQVKKPFTIKTNLIPEWIFPLLLKVIYIHFSLAVKHTGVEADHRPSVLFLTDEVSGEVTTSCCAGPESQIPESPWAHWRREHSPRPGREKGDQTNESRVKSNWVW